MTRSTFVRPAGAILAGVVAVQLLWTRPAGTQAALAPDPARTARLAWFHEAKYGLFIHWGLYAIPAGEWQGKRSLGLGEWIMFRTPVPVRDY